MIHDLIMIHVIIGEMVIAESRPSQLVILSSDLQKKNFDNMIVSSMIHGRVCKCHWKWMHLFQVVTKHFSTKQEKCFNQNVPFNMFLLKHNQ